MIVIVNDNYKHYAGEIQIVKIPIVNDGTRNRIGHLDEDEYQMMEFIYDGELVEFFGEISRRKVNMGFPEEFFVGRSNCSQSMRRRMECRRKRNGGF